MEHTFILKYFKIFYKITSGTFILFLTALFLTSSVGAGTVKWKVRLEPLSEAQIPAVGRDGTIYVSSNTSDGHGSVIAVNPNGAIKWTFPIDEKIFSITVAPNNTIYFISRQNLHVLSADGVLLWTYNDNGNLYYSYSSDGDLAIDSHGVAYVRGTNHNDGGYINGYQMHAVDSNGSQQWAINYYQIGSPVIDRNGEFLYATTGTLPGSLVAFNASNGSVAWQKPAGSYSSLPTIGADGNVYVSSENMLYAYNDSGVLKWQYRFHGGFGQPGQPVTNGDGTIYASSNDHVTGKATLHAYSPDGTELWHWIQHSHLSGSPAIGSDGIIYLGSAVGLAAIDPSLGNDFSLLWELKEIDGKFRIYPWSSPILGYNNTLYVVGSEYIYPKSEIHLYAITISSPGPTSSSWPMARGNPQGTQMAQKTTYNNFEKTGKIRWYECCGFGCGQGPRPAEWGDLNPDEPKEVLEAESGEKLRITCGTYGYHIIPSYFMFYTNSAGEENRVGQCMFEGGCNSAWFTYVDANGNGVPDYFLRTTWISKDYGANDNSFYDDKLEWRIFDFDVVTQSLDKSSVEHEYALEPPIECCNSCSVKPEGIRVSYKTIDPPLGTETERFFDEAYESLQSVPPDATMKVDTGLLCDFNNDGECNNEDLSYFSGLLGSCKDGNDLYDIVADIDRSGCIDQKDQYLLFGQDADGDGVPDKLDNCPASPNPNQADTDADGIGDACEATMVKISGGAYNFPESARYRATFSMDVSGPSDPGGWLKYYYSRTRLNFASTAITEVVVFGGTLTVFGEGTVNGAPGYTFTAQATDASQDQFGITIKKSDGSTLYSTDPATTGGGDLNMEQL